MPCVTIEPEIKYQNHLEMMLEQVCRLLTREQLSLIDGIKNSGWIKLLEWYTSHLLHDYAKNYNNEVERIFYENEALRIGCKLEKISYGYQITSI